MEIPEGLDATGLEAHLKQACGGDEDLLRKVSVLVAKDREETGFMDGPALQGGGGLSSEEEGTTIDHYKLLQEIGRGGFGVVYMAEQLRPVKRRVALKIIKLGMDTRQVVARFEVERQALAMMDHPNIAKVYDAGATELGRPYFVMELVRGLPITEFCEAQKLGVPERLELFIDVCGALQHAHQKGIIHRDLKPSNVIVTIHDDKAVPKVIDFGVAKATQQDLTDKTLFTRFEQFIGTPAYMSPEQCEMGGLDIDTRSDIYSLGVLLYELLTGTTPIDARALAGASHEELRRAIREEEPETPSTRSTGRKNRRIKAETGKHPAVPLELDRELDWIVMKALEKDRKRRYETATGLAADVRRHLNCEPVEAGPPGLTYRIGKVVRRHRAAVFTSAAMLALLLGGVTTSSWQWLRAAQSQKDLKVERDRALANGEEARRNKDQAVGERLASLHQRIEGLFAEKKVNLAIAHLARLIREDPGNRVAGERLMSALRHHVLPVRDSPLLERAIRKGISPDGNYSVMMSSDSVAGHRISRTDGGPSPFPLIPSLEEYVPAPGVAFHPLNNRQVLLSYLNTSNGYRSAVRLWDLEKNAEVGEVVTFENSVPFVGFSPDGSLAYAAAYQGPIHVWGADPGSQVNWRKGADSLVCAVSFSPDSRLIAVATKRGRVTFRDARTGERTLPLLEHDSAVWTFAFSPEGDRLITGTQNGVAEIWDLRAGESTGVRIDHSSDVRALEFSPNGLAVLTGSQEGRVRVWDATTGEPVTETMEVGTEDQGRFLISAHFDDTGTRVVGATHQQFKVWSIASEKEIGGIPDGFQMRDVFFEKNSDRLFACDRRSQIWMSRNDQPLGRIFRHHETGNGHGPFAVHAARFAGEGDLLLTSGEDGYARLWNVARAEEVARFSGRNLVVWSELSPDRNYAVVASHSSTFLYRVEDGKMIKNLREQGQGTTPKAIFSPVRDDQGRSRFATTSKGKDACVRIWNGETGEQIGPDLPLAPGVGTQGGAGGWFGILQFSSNGELLAAFDGENRVVLWDLSGDPDDWHVVREFIQKEGFWGRYWGFHLSHDEKSLVIYGLDHRLLVWDVETGEQREPVMAHSAGLICASFSPSDDRIVTGSGDHTARIWDAETLTPIGLPMRHDAVIIWASFSPDGRRVVTTSIDGTARVWDAQTGFPLSDPLRHEGGLLYTEFAQGGREVVTTSYDGTARVWDLPPAPDGEVPEWVAGWAEALAGLRISQDESETPAKVSWEEARDLVETARQHEGEAFYGEMVSWYHTNPRGRSLSPWCDYSVDDYLRHRLEEIDHKGLSLEGSLEEVLRIQPDHAEAMAKLAEWLLAVERADKMPDLSRARYLAHLAVSLEPETPEYRHLVARVEAQLEEVNEVRELELLEAKTRKAFEAGNRELARSMMKLAVLERLKGTAEADWWPPAEEAGELFTNWVEFGRKGILVPKGASWKYFDDPEASVPEGWHEPGFADEQWAEGRARLGFSRNGEDGEVTRLEKGPEGAERLTFYFRHRFLYDPNDLEMVPGGLVLNLLRDDGAVVYLNGQEILRSNMPDRNPEETTLALTAVGGNEEHAFIPCLTGRHHLRAGENVLAVEVHQSGRKSSDVSFDLEVALGEHPFPEVAGLSAGGKFSDEQAAFLHWTFGGPAETIEAIDRILAPLAGSFEPVKIRQRKKWWRRKAWILYSSGREDEALRLLDQVETVPPRDPGLDPQCLDLGTLYTSSLYEKNPPRPGSPAVALERLPESFDPKGGPSFDLRGWIQLKGGDSGSDASEDGTESDTPAKVEIPVGRSCRKIHFLHGARTVADDSGVVIARYRMHFEDGSGFEEEEMVLGRDVAGLWLSERPAQETVNLEGIAWTHPFRTNSRQATLGLTQMTWENRSGKKISHIEFVSTGKETLPVLYAVTLE